MEFKKCTRCGNFFITNTIICGDCSNKENLEISKLKNYFETNEGEVASIENLSYQTGITVKNLNRQLQGNTFGGGLENGVGFEENQ